MTDTPRIRKLFLVCASVVALAGATGTSLPWLSSWLHEPPFVLPAQHLPQVGSITALLATTPKNDLAGDTHQTAHATSAAVLRAALQVEHSRWYSRITGPCPLGVSGKLCYVDYKRPDIINDGIRALLMVPKVASGDVASENLFDDIQSSQSASWKYPIITTQKFNILSSFLFGIRLPGACGGRNILIKVGSRPYMNDNNNASIFINDHEDRNSSLIGEINIFMELPRTLRYSAAVSKLCGWPKLQPAPVSKSALESK